MLLWMAYILMGNLSTVYGATDEVITLTKEQTDFCKQSIATGILIMDGEKVDWKDITLCWRNAATYPKFKGTIPDGFVTYYYGVAAVPMLDKEMHHPSIVAYLFCFEKIDHPPGLKFNGVLQFALKRGF